MNRMYDVIVVGGGQAGLAAGYHLTHAGVRFVILESARHPGGSWPSYYDSLRLFSPARYSGLPGLPFPGAPDHYPARDEVTTYLQTYADHFALPVLTNVTVQHVHHTTDGFVVQTADGATYRSRAVIAATGAFGTPYVPDLPSQDTFHGQVLHAATYRNPDPFVGKRVVIVGAANSAVQIGVELAQVARVTLATRHPLRFVPQHLLGYDLHAWLHWTGLDYVPWLKDTGGAVLDTGAYRAAFAAQKLDQRSMFLRCTETGVLWSETQHEPIDVLLFATGYRPHLAYVAPLGALDAQGFPVHTKGVSRSVPGVYYVGLSGQRAFRSATLRGVGADAAYVVRKVRQYLGAASPRPHNRKRQCCAFIQRAS